MIFGWKNNPEWVRYYEEKKKERIESMIKNQNIDHLKMIRMLQNGVANRQLVPRGLQDL